ncbi:MAG: phytanoyl-CoA dioxygenase family protein [Pirellulaceae bacterium]|nr:phytanoyl-CoA dioxygenase family protein [Pirellulaceae bacterium]
MDIVDYQTAPNIDPVINEIDKYNLYKHIVELEAYGLTIVPPETLGVDEQFVARLRGAIIRTCEKRNKIELGDYRTSVPPVDKTGKNSWDLLEEDEVFVEAAINPVQMALVRWLLGQSAVFSGQTWIIKGEGASGIGLHSDSHGIPPGAGHIAHMCNASWICTDYAGAEDGPTVFVPGSHRYGRATLPHEADRSNSPFKYVPVIAKAGSLALWNGATWHASEPRTKPGLRVTLVQNYMRSYMRPQHNYEIGTSPQLLEKYPELARVIGKALYPYEDSQNPEPSRIMPFMKTGTDQFA